MGETGFVFGLMGMSFGLSGVVFGIIVWGRLDKLVKHLKENDVIDKDYKFEQKLNSYGPDTDYYFIQDL